MYSMKQEAIAVYAVGTVLISVALWFASQTTSQEEFDLHVTDKQCERATDRWIKKANQLDERPADKMLIQQEREAKEMKLQQCSKSG